MTISQLRYVLQVAGSSSMREASTKLFISQPALSSGIHDLEEELGIRIFERTNKGISLTDEGYLDYMQKGGRCSSVVALGGKLLRIKPEIAVVDGTMKMVDKYVPSSLSSWHLMPA